MYLKAWRLLCSRLSAFILKSQIQTAQLSLAGFALVMAFSFQNCSGDFSPLSSVAGSSFCSVDGGDAACKQSVSQCQFNGQPLAEGEVVTAFLASTVASGQTCVQQTRTCENAALSGSYSYATCTPGAAVACLFDGRTVASGSSVSAYLNSTVAAGGTCAPETRICTEGVLSGTAAYGSCQASGYAACLFDGRTIPHGASVMAFALSSVSTGGACVSQSRTCFNGALSGAGDFGSCEVNKPASCLFNGRTVSSGASVAAYAASSVPFGSTCQIVSRVCSNGSLSGAGDFGSCAVGAPAACMLNGQTVANGSTLTVYKQAQAPVGGVCETEVRSCANGVLSGSATAPTCTVKPPPRLSDYAKVAGQDVMIPAGVSLEIDNTPPIGLLQVAGELHCATSGDVTLKADGIQVYGGGVFRCGSQTSRFAGTLNIELTGDRIVMGGKRSFVIFDGGELQLNGRARNFAWVRLAKTAEAGSKSLSLTAAVDWSVGDHIALAPTSFDPHEAEELVIQSVSADGLTVAVTSALTYKHWGGVQAMASSRQTWNLDESAEVANLSRNIRIYAPGTAASLDYLGGHVMVMAPGKAYVDGVEFTRMGRMGEMARYPFHWHRAGDVSGQYIVNSSFHSTFQRCVTVHGTNNALVKNNICFDHFGHGFFLEDGNETGNQFLGNLGILTKTPLANRHILQSDIDRTQLPRWAGPSTFWISNPANTFIGNVAAGSEGSGFWGAFIDKVYCDAAACTIVVDGSPANVFPSKTAMGKFDLNSSRSSLIGMTWDGGDQGALANNPRNPNDRLLTAVHYTPPSMPTATRLSVSKSSLTGVYFRGQAFAFDQSIFADNRTGVWLAYNQRVTNSAFIGQSQNHADAEYNYLGNLGADPTYMSAVWIYDGPLELTNVDFLQYSSTAVMYQGLNVTPVPFRTVGGADRFVNRTQGLTFSPEPWRRFILKPDNWLDSPYSMSVLDIDGSLLGSPGSYLMQNEPYNNDGSCVEIPNTRGMRCASKPGLIYFGTLLTPFQMVRSDGAATRSIADLGGPGSLFNKAGLVLNKGYEYSMYFGSGVVSRNYVGFLFQAESVGQLSPVIRMANIGTGCTLATSQGAAAQLGSVEALRASTQTSSFQSGPDLWVKLQANNAENLAPQRMANGSFALRCENPTVEDLRLSPFVFDAGYYRASYADLAAFTELQLRQHWLTSGIAEARKASALFWVDEYLTMNDDVAKASGARNFDGAVVHYILHGHSEGRAGRAVVSPLVYNGSQYQSLNADLSLMRDDQARDHWLSNGMKEGRRASVDFSSQVYLSKYQDLRDIFGATNYPEAVRHFPLQGAKEGRTGK